MTGPTRRTTLAILASLTMPARAADRVRFAVTTTVENSGLAAWLIPKAEAATGTRIEMVVVGTGQAHALARQGDVDMVMTHAPEDEAALVADGTVIERSPVMANDFVLVGPDDDPAGIGNVTPPVDAMKAIMAKKAPFISRGDRSGTHVRELALWREAGLDPSHFGNWYRPIGGGMGAALNMAAGIGAYTLTDRGTWLAFGNTAGLTLLFEGKPPIDNPYSVMIVNPDRHPHVALSAARRVRDWLIGTEGQAVIGAFRIKGQPAFRPVKVKEAS